MQIFLFVLSFGPMSPSDIVNHFKGAASAAASLGFHRRTIYYWIAEGAIPWRTQKHIEFQTGGALKAAPKKAKRA